MKKSPKLIQKFKFWSDHPGTFMMNGSSHDLIRSDSIHFSIPTWSTWVFIFSYFSNIIWNVSYCRTLKVSNTAQHLKAIFMVFGYGQIYYNSRTSKYKQILTNKSQRHEILKSYYTAKGSPRPPIRKKKCILVNLIAWSVRRDQFPFSKIGF